LAGRYFAVAAEHLIGYHAADEIIDELKAGGGPRPDPKPTAERPRR